MVMKYINIIQQELTNRKAKDPNYSLRSFAKDLELSPSSLSELFNGKHHLSIRTFGKIAVKLNLSEETRKETIEFLNYEMNKNRAHTVKKSQSEILKDLPDEMVNEVTAFLATMKTKNPEVPGHSLSVLVDSVINQI
jgi:transcriptional regulator with XRE-family HTH domain